MLAIRLKRTGRKAYAVYRIAVQEAQRHPSSGKVVAYVGSYNPHTKEANFDKEQVEKYLSHGAQPTPRIVKLLKDAKIKLPSWVKEPNLGKLALLVIRKSCAKMHRRRKLQLKRLLPRQWQLTRRQPKRSLLRRPQLIQLNKLVLTGIRRPGLHSEAGFC